MSKNLDCGLYDDWEVRLDWWDFGWSTFPAPLWWGRSPLGSLLLCLTAPCCLIVGVHSEPFCSCEDLFRKSPSRLICLVKLLDEDGRCWRSLFLEDSGLFREPVSCLAGAFVAFFPLWTGKV